ncbi:bifunctional 2-dehydro-3-deoxyphosphogluconate aldolase /4-hydroxy-2-oxoglutarate aldolase [Galdieria sulphuraria]|uniref:Bifunctional 2-dehydro-3-deoxyphosphogluconate aldolase /4-hydroxy-2-oxoglutarate aldolase n=1 Tax=Galdieria sulphuraria TaxID=130081 RepID=M2VXM3_GALSU|nr:bifunctional 2-dehydro-3-deoxyphosphogluconate aldolase /4-hydroxy-2-oxoglutarate aldolase [Galdieria sulphuraria]EME28026.1 bifunctional 2-dehydro-3-deoxyphosphogluconate aldolase /4-hydroxy-2-oxoglutarate aldolase [Galdieria sulphuraria]|eukprot:XP_005704546.1 bifunctional 2-dehydro-3-deoxyphosphogluconate aldolase /4-hydroxy-2-oxoglutarate aldolase [Galdieria sulphuraria]
MFQTTWVPFQISHKKCKRQRTRISFYWKQHTFKVLSQLKSEQVLDKLYKSVVVCVRQQSFSTALKTCRALMAGGLDRLEITLTTPDAFELIHTLSNEYPQATIGAGTVLKPSQVKLAAKSGALFIMSPVLVHDVIEEAKRHDLLAIPGGTTPSEIYNCFSAGASLVKLFPVESFGGLSLVKTVAGPFPDIPLLPTSGITLNALPE